MSRSNNTELVSPADKFFKWSGEKGTLAYWDKNAGEKGENVEVKQPFRFLVLDKLVKIGGGVDDGNSYKGYWSNAIRDRQLKTGILTVRSKGGIEASGTYDQVKGLTGAKFVQHIYIAYQNDDKQLAIGCLDLSGAALSAWFDFTKNIKNLFDGGFAINGKTKKKKGSNTYFEPVFERVAVPDGVNAEATELDTKLQNEYLIPYFSRDTEPEYHLPVEQEDNDELGNSPPKAKAASASTEELPEFVTEDVPNDTDDVDIPW